MTLSENPTRVNVTLLIRKALPGQRSLERVFANVANALPSDIACRTVVVPFTSRGVVRRLANTVFAAFVRGDVVHVTGDIYYCAAAVRSRRCLLTIHDMVSMRRLGGWRARIFFLIWYKIPARRACQITTISHSTLGELLELLPTVGSKATVVPDPIGPEFFNTDAPRKLHDPPVILQVGTGANKNLESLVIAAHGLPVKLRIIGQLTRQQRVLLDRLKVDYSSCFDLSDEEMVDAYRDSDVLVFASTYEGFGMPIVEAQAIGVPVITSNIWSMPEVMGEAGISVDPSNPQAIRSALLELLTSQVRRESLTAAGYLNAQRFEAATVAAKYAAIYRVMAADVS